MFSSLFYVSRCIFFLFLLGIYLGFLSMNGVFNKFFENISHWLFEYWLPSPFCMFSTFLLHIVLFPSLFEVLFVCFSVLLIYSSFLIIFFSIV